MKYTVTTTALIAASASTALSAQLINGNWYGKPVERIMYTDWGQSGTYQRVSDMSNGQCTFEEVQYGGGTSPLDEEVSWHFRGPMHLKQFAFYTPGSSNSKRSLKPSSAQRDHDHAHAHAHHQRGIGHMVTATINGVVVSWANSYAGAATSAHPAAMPGATMPSSQTSVQAVPTTNAGAGNWGRQAYYNAANGTADGLLFLNNMGGQGSGVFDTHFGNSLSYASSNGQSGAASPQILSDTLIKDNAEVILFSDKPCNRNNCGIYRPGSVAYHGFGGASKLFLVEFQMPMSGKTGWNMDMPAAWMLNAAIPRTEQYGACSCWASGCGEWDIFEILDSGNTRAKSTLHAGASSGGESDFFQRPVDKTMKAAILFDGVNSLGDIIVLPDDTTFDAVLADDIVSSFGKTSVLHSLTKVFKVGLR